MSWSIRRRFFIGFLGIALILAFVGIWTYRCSVRLVAADDAVSRTYRILNALTSLDALLKNAESSERGYLVTGNEGYLAAYERSIASVDKAVDALKFLAADDPALMRRFETLQPAIERKISVLKTEQELCRFYGLESATRWIQAGPGKQLMEEIGKLLADITSEEQVVLAERLKQADRSGYIALLAIIGGPLVNISLIAIIAMIITKQVTRPLYQAMEAAEQAGIHISRAEDAFGKSSSTAAIIQEKSSTPEDVMPKQ